MRNKTKLIATLVDENLNPIGFMIEEQNSMGMVNKYSMRKEELIARGINTSQVRAVNGQLFEVGQFKINSLPMLMVNNGQTVPIPNDISLVGRIVNKNKNVEYRVAIMNGTKTANLPVSTIVQLSYFFKPTNFCARTNSNNNTFLFGTNGTKIDDLPIVNNVQQTSKRAAPNTVKKAGVEPIVQTGFDVIELIEALRKVDGQIIRFPGEKYNATGRMIALDSKGFIDAGVGEIASARGIEFNATKLNVNAPFKKLGVVKVNVNGAGVKTVDTFQYRTKHIFSAGQKHINNIGIAVDIENVDKLRSLIGDVRLTPIAESTATKRFNGALGEMSGRAKFFTVDMDNTDLISKEHMQKAIMSPSEIAKLCEMQYEHKLVLKVLRPGTGFWAKEAKKQLKDRANVAANKKIYAPYSVFSKDFLEACTEAGIDIYTGAYMGSPEDKMADNSEGKALADSNAVEIIYKLMDKNYDKITGKQIVNAVKNGDQSFLSDDSFNRIKKVLDESENNLEAAYEYAMKFAEIAEVNLRVINEKFWLHNAAMYTAGGRLTVHNQDKGDWTETAKTAKSKYDKFICKSVPNLVLAIEGIEMAK